MAEQLPLPNPPRSPTSISDEDNDLPTAGLGIEGAYGSSPVESRYRFDASSSPPSEAAGSASVRTDLISPIFSLTASSPHDLYSPLTPQSVNGDSHFQKMDKTEPVAVANPFNFTPQQYSVGKPTHASAASLARAVRLLLLPPSPLRHLRNPSDNRTNPSTFILPSNL